MNAQIDTFHGGKIDLANPSAAQVDLDDIARALSRLCRFAGHSSEFYSVAQHAIFVSRIIGQLGYAHLRPWALHHDSHESYIGDLSSPLKSLLRQNGEMSVLTKTAAALDKAIREAMGINHPRGHEIHMVKHADLLALTIEAKSLMPDGFEAPDVVGLEPILQELQLGPILPPDEARTAFVAEHSSLGLRLP